MDEKSFSGGNLSDSEFSLLTTFKKAKKDQSESYLMQKKTLSHYLDFVIKNDAVIFWIVGMNFLKQICQQADGESPSLVLAHQDV